MLWILAQRISDFKEKHCVQLLRENSSATKSSPKWLSNVFITLCVHAHGGD
jgi:hypothetical protein